MKTTKKRIKSILAALAAATVLAPCVITASAATDKVTVVKDDITVNTLSGGDWQTKQDGKISHRWSGGVTAKLGGYETGGCNVNAFATTKPVTFADDEDLMAEYDVLGVTSSTVHFGVMQGRMLGDTSAWDYNYGFVNTFGYYSGADSTSFTFESASADYKFPEVYENGAWVKAQKGNLDLKEGSYRIRQIYRSAATDNEAAIEIFVAPVSEDGVYDWTAENVKRYRATAKQVAGANANGFQNFKIGDGYVGINVEDVGVNEGGGVILDNVKFSKISATGTDIKSVIVQANFEDKKLPLELTMYGLNVDKCLTYIDYSDLKFDNADKSDLLYSKFKISLDERSETALDAAFDVSAGTAGNAFLGIATGIKTENGYSDDCLTAGVEISGGNAVAAFYLSGEKIAETDSFAWKNDEYKRVELQISNGKNDTVKAIIRVGESETEVKVKRSVVEGYIALGNFSDSPAEFYIDNIDVKRYIYSEYAGKNITADFENGAPNDEWYYQTSGSVKLSNDIVPSPDCARYTADSGVKFENGAMHFDRTGDTAMFGPKRSYGDWEFKFDLLQYQYEATSTGEGDEKLWTPASQWFGFSFHKGSSKSTFAASSVYSLMMTRRKTTDANKSELTLFGWQIPSYDGTAVVPVNAPASEPLSIRITAVNQTITVEYKLQKEGDTEWKNVVSFGDVNTAGYMSFSSTNWTNFTVDNVSVKNLDKYYDVNNYPDLLVGESRKKFDAASPEDVTFDINVGRYSFELLGSKIFENDYVVDADSNTITIKKEFLQKFPEGTRNFYIRNQFGEELRVTVEIKNEQKTDNDELSSGESLQKGGCKSSVSALPLTGAGCLFALAVALKKSGGKDEKTEE